MPKLDPNEQLVFLWNCHKNSQENDGKIDFEEIGKAYGIKGGAAYFRYYRMGKAIEAGMSDRNGPTDVKGDATAKDSTVAKSGGKQDANGNKSKGNSKRRKVGLKDALSTDLAAKVQAEDGLEGR